MASPLENYLKTHRQRSGLTQSELASLLGFDSSVNIFRYERGIRKPNLERALALQMLFEIRVDELFPAVNEKVARILIARITELEKAVGDATTPQGIYKLETLADIRTQLERRRGSRS